MSTYPEQRLTSVEVLAASLTSWLALAGLIGYALDIAGFGVQAWGAPALALLITGSTAALTRRDDRRAAVDLGAWLGIVVFLIAVLLRFSWPALVPPGRGPDLTHHLLLVDYIEQHGHLVHDRSLDGAMGEMAHYTPLSHLLAVMAGRWFGTDGLHTFFPLAVVCAALTAGFVFLIARRQGLALPFAIAATVLLLLPAQYFIGAFTHDSFLAQSVSTLFAVAMWWALGAWDDRPSLLSAAMTSVLLAATYLSWPIWLGPPLLVFVALALKADLARGARRAHVAIVLLPFLALALIHSWHRWGWMVIVRTSGAVLHPSLESVGWFLPALAAIGVLAALSDPRARNTVALLLVIALQALTLFVIAKVQGASTPYMAFKMMYLAIYPLAVLGAVGLARLTDAMPLRSGRASRVSETAGWLFAAALLIAAARPALAGARNVPVVNEDLYAAGKWIRAHGAATCTDYLVADAETAYWLHLAVLGNPRASQRMNEVDRYEARAAIAPWITADGRRYGIADMRLLPEEVASRVDVVARFGNAAVITRRGAIIKGCD